MQDKGGDMGGKHRREEHGHGHDRKKEQREAKQAAVKPDEKQAKIQKMESIYAKLDDVMHSQKALMEKAANLQLALLETPDKELEASFNTVYSNASVNSDLLGKALHDYQIKINVMKQ
jgi:hypothetical protein